MEVISRFEAMLKTNDIYFFDIAEFEEVINHYLDNSEDNLARLSLKIGLSQHPDATSLLLLQVEIWINENRLNLAEKQLKKLLLLIPYHPDIYLQFGLIYSKKRKHLKAIEMFDKTLYLGAQYDINVWHLKAAQYICIDAFSKAKECYIKCLAIDMEDEISLSKLISIFEIQSMHDKAIEFLIKFTDKKPYCGLAWFYIAKQYIYLEEYKNALGAFDYAILSDGHNVRNYIEKAKILEILKEYKKAIEHYTIALELNDEPIAIIFYRLGYCYEQIANAPDKNKNQRLYLFKKAIYYYKKSVTEDPILEKSWHHLAYLYTKTNHLKQALGAYKKLNELYPENKDYKKYLDEVCKMYQKKTKENTNQKGNSNN